MLAHIFEHVAVCNVVLYRIAARVEIGVVQGAAGDNIGGVIDAAAAFVSVFALFQAVVQQRGHGGMHQPHREGRHWEHSYVYASNTYSDCNTVFSGRHVTKEQSEAVITAEG